MGVVGEEILQTQNTIIFSATMSTNSGCANNIIIW
jgi:hypothetical protein